MVKKQNCVLRIQAVSLYTKTNDTREDIAEDVEIRFDTSNHELDRPLPKWKKQKCNWINETWIRWKSHETICWIKITVVEIKKQKAQKSVT